MLGATGGRRKAAADYTVDPDQGFNDVDIASHRAAGRTLHDGFNPGGSWDLSAYTCRGPVTDSASAAAALLAAVRGARLLVGPIDPAVAPMFIDELHRLAAATGRRLAGLPSPVRVIDPVAAALLDALAEGLTMPAAARRCAVSLRTAHRRLAAARVTFDMPTTGALVVRAAQRLGSSA